MFARHVNVNLCTFLCRYYVCSLWLYLAEESRIYKAGGWVEFNRVNGNLALSRAIGDFNFKSNQRLKPEEQIITGMSLSLSLSLSRTCMHLYTSLLNFPHALLYSTLADPEIITTEIHPKDEFVVLACDGKCLVLILLWLICVQRQIALTFSVVFLYTNKCRCLGCDVKYRGDWFCPAKNSRRDEHRRGENE